MTRPQLRRPGPYGVCHFILVLLLIAASPGVTATARADVVSAWAAHTDGRMVDIYDPSVSDTSLLAAAHEHAALADLVYEPTNVAGAVAETRGFSLIADGGSVGTDTRYYVFRDRRHAIVVFRGSDSPLDWALNAQVQTAPLPPYMGAHVGFASSAQSVIVEVRDDLDDARLAGVESIIVAGHSLGGAVAQLIAHRLEQLDYPIANVFTFGAPGAGRGTWNLTYTNMASRTHAFQDHRDLVPCLPADQTQWFHSGNLHEVREDSVAIDTPTDCSTIAIDVFNVVHGVATASVLCGGGDKPWRRAVGALWRVFNPAAIATCEVPDPISALIQLGGSSVLDDRPLNQTHHAIAAYFSELDDSLPAPVRENLNRDRSR